MAFLVWIDQDLCTGDGICEEICPDVFVGREDGLWVVKEEAKHFGASIVYDLALDEEEHDDCTCGVMSGTHAHRVEGSRGMARVPDSLIEDTIEAAVECPGECIMIEPI